MVWRYQEVLKFCHNWDFNFQSINIAAQINEIMNNNSILQIRTIQPLDNPVLAKIIRSALTEFGADHPGTVYFNVY